MKLLQLLDCGSNLRCGGRERNFSHLTSLWRLWYHSWLMISQVCFWLEIPSDPLLESSLCSPFLGVTYFLLKYESWHWDGIGDASKIWKIGSFRHTYQEVLSPVMRDSWLAQYTDSLQRHPHLLEPWQSTEHSDQSLGILVWEGGSKPSLCFLSSLSRCYLWVTCSGSALT